MKNTSILVFDTETTDIPAWKVQSGDPSQPHIVQIAAHVVDIESRKIKQTMNVIVKPDDWEITQETIDIHGITNEYAKDNGIPESLAIKMFIELWRSCWLRVAHNTTFDNRIIRIATKRYLDDKTIDDWKAGEYFCTCLGSQKIMTGKRPKLTEAYKRFTGKDLEGAHQAIVDTDACLDVYWGIIDYNAESK